MSFLQAQEKLKVRKQQEEKNVIAAAAESTLEEEYSMASQRSAGAYFLCLLE